MNQRSIFGFPQNVFILSVVSFLNDIGGETIKRTIPLFLTNVLHVSSAIVGLVEGLGEATPHLFQPISGYLSDRYKKRKPFVLGSQLLRTAMVLLFFATSWVEVLVVRFLDRSAKGINSAPRDALISASVDDKHKGRAFGLSRALDNGGAVVGLGLAGLITLSLVGGSLFTRVSFQQIVVLAIIPQVIAFILIFLFVRDVPASHEHKEERGFHLTDYPEFVSFLTISLFFTLGNSSDAFLLLRAQGLGMPIPLIFFLLAAMSLVASLTNVPLASLSDRLGRKTLLIWGWVLYTAVYLGFALAHSIFTIVGLFLLYGLYYGMTEGAARALVSDLVAKRWQGTAFGIYFVTTGLTLFLASLLAGFLWQVFSPAVAFLFGASMSLAAVVGLGLVLPKTVNSQ